MHTPAVEVCLSNEYYNIYFDSANKLLEQIDTNDLSAAFLLPILLGVGKKEWEHDDSWVRVTESYVLDVLDQRSSSSSSEFT